MAMQTSCLWNKAHYVKLTSFIGQKGLNNVREKNYVILKLVYDLLMLFLSESTHV